MTAASERVSPQQSHVDRLTALIDVIRSLTSERETNDIVRGALRAAIDVIEGADVGILFLYDRDQQKLTVNHAVGLSTEAYDIAIEPGEGLSGRAFLEGHAQLYPDEPSVRRGMGTASENNLAIFERAAHGIRYPQSALSAALVYKGEPMGAFVVENLHTPGLFDRFDVELVDALAQAAATAIVNARFYESEREGRIRLEVLNEEVFRQRNDLERRLQVRDSIAEYLREGLPLEALASRIVTVCGGAVVFLDALNRVRALEPALDVATAHDLPWTSWETLSRSLERATMMRAPQKLPIGTQGELLVTPSIAGGEVLGFVLLALSERTLDETDEAALDSAALVVATEFLREQRVHEQTVRRQSDLLGRLLSGRTPTDAWSIPSLRPPLRMAVGGLHGDDPPKQSPDLRVSRMFVALAQESLGSAGRNDSVMAHEGYLVVIRSMRDVVEGSSFETDLEAVTAKVRRLLPSWHSTFVVTDQIAQISDLVESYRDARAALKIIDDVPNHADITAVSDFGAARLVLRAASSRESIDLCQRALGAILSYDGKHGGELLPTFRAYLRHGLSAKATADALNVHPNTVQYRLRRLQELSELDLKQPDDRLTLELAIRILDTSAALAATPN